MTLVPAAPEKPVKTGGGERAGRMPRTAGGVTERARGEARGGAAEQVASAAAEPPNEMRADVITSAAAREEAPHGAAKMDREEIVKMEEQTTTMETGAEDLAPELEFDTAESELNSGEELLLEETAEVGQVEQSDRTEDAGTEESEEETEDEEGDLLEAPEEETLPPPEPEAEDGAGAEAQAEEAAEAEYTRRSQEIATQALGKNMNQLLKNHPDLTPQLVAEIAQIAQAERRRAAIDYQVRESRTAKQREEKSYLNFIEEYPEIRDYAREIPQEVFQKVRAGEDIVSAYRAYENRKLKEELAAVKQELVNRRTSVGSARGAGEDEYDEFLEALFS